MFGRKLLLAPALALFTVGGAGSAGDLQHFFSNTAVGSWEVTITPEAGGPPPFEALFTFHEDGTVLESDDGPPTPHLFTAGHGVWKWTDRREFAATYKQINFDEAANTTGIFRGRVKFTLGRNANTINGVVVVEFYLPDGTLVFTGNATAKGRRIEVDPLQ